MARHTKNSETRPSLGDPESLAELVGDGIRLSRRWPVAHTPPIAPPTPWSRIHGVRVPDHSAHLLDGISDYGD